MYIRLFIAWPSPIMEVDEQPFFSTSIDFNSFRPSVYSLERPLVLDEVAEMIAEPNGRLVFLRMKGRAMYQVVDIFCGSVVEYELDDNEFTEFDEFRLLPLQKDPHSSSILCRQRNDTLWSYHIAHFRMDLTDFRLKRANPWTKIMESFGSSGSCFIDGGRIHFLCEDRRHRLIFRRFNVLNECFECKTIRFEDDVETALWNAWEYKFRTCFRSQIYGFLRFRDRSDCTNNLDELTKCFSVIVKKRLRDGKIKRRKLRNTLECLNIREESYDDDTTFFIDGQWIRHQFYLHIRVQSSPSSLYPFNYFALLDVFTRLWHPIQVHMPRGKLTCPMQILALEDGQGAAGQLTFFRSFSSDEMHGYDLYRLPTKTPSPLATMCAIKVDDYHRKNSLLLDQLSHFLFQPLNC